MERERTGRTSDVADEDLESGGCGALGLRSDVLGWPGEELRRIQSVLDDGPEERED